MSFQLYGSLRTLMFILQLFVANLIFMSFHQKRNMYFLRLIVSSITAFAIILLLPTNRSNNLYTFAIFLLDFFLLVVTMVISYKASIWEVFFCCSAGMALQHFAGKLQTMIKLVWSFEHIIKGSLTFSIIAIYLNDLVTYPLICIAFYWIFVKKISKEHYINSISFKPKVVSAIIVFICIGINRFVSNFRLPINLMIATSIYAMICTFFALIIQFYFYKEAKMIQDLQIIKQLNRQGEKYYEEWKENLDIINIKYHDIRHYLSKLNGKNDGYVGEINKAVSYFEKLSITGNKVIDVILFEKKFICEKNQIDFSFIVDGDSLREINDVDIYSLFGNIIENAIEAVKKIEILSKRIIILNVRAMGEAVSINILNSYVGELIIHEGLPVTNNNKIYHGFGMKSIKQITEKYGGKMNLTTDNGVFSLNIILFPKKNK